MLPSSTSYSSSFPFRSNDDPVIFTLYSTAFSDMNPEEDFSIDHFYNQQTNDLIKWVKNNGDFSEMIENMFEWNVMGTLSDGVRVFYIDDNEKEVTEEEMREENEYFMNAVENEEIIVEEEEIIEMSGVSLYEGCYDIEMKLIEEGFVSRGNNNWLAKTINSQFT